MEEFRFAVTITFLVLNFRSTGHRLLRISQVFTAVGRSFVSPSEPIAWIATQQKRSNFFHGRRFEKQSTAWVKRYSNSFKTRWNSFELYFRFSTCDQMNFGILERTMCIESLWYPESPFGNATTRKAKHKSRRRNKFETLRKYDLMFVTHWYFYQPKMNSNQINLLE